MGSGLPVSLNFIVMLTNDRVVYIFWWKERGKP